MLEQETELAAAATAPREIAAPAVADTAPAIAQAATLLAAAQRPAILAGGGSRGASSELRALAERIGAPVVTTLNAKGVLDEQHPLAVGSNLRLQAGRSVAQDADVLLIVGSKLGEAELWVSELAATGHDHPRRSAGVADHEEPPRRRRAHPSNATATLAALITQLGDGSPRDHAGAVKRGAARPGTRCSAR